MTLLAIIMWAIITWSVIQYWTQPLDSWLVEQKQEQPLYVGTATWYDYTLNGQQRSKTHNTCALRIYERYQTYKVCSKVTWKCVNCYHNDYWPQRQDRVIDLSSHAFKELWIPLSRGVTEVEVYLVE